MRLYLVTREEVERAMAEGQLEDTPKGPRRVLSLGDETIRVAYVVEGDTTVVVTILATGRWRRERGLA